MFRKALLATACAFALTPAYAQNTTCADRPLGDSSNACANTRFVSSTSGASIALPANACTGADDTAAIQTAVNTAAAVPGQTVVFPARTCLVSLPGISVLNSQGVKLLGQGAGNTANPVKTEIVYTSASGSLLKIDGAEGFRWSGIRGRYNNASYNGDLIDARQVSGSGLTAALHFDDFVLTGTQGTAQGANSLIRVGNTLDVHMHDGFMQFAARGIYTDGVNPTNDFNIHNIWFQNFAIMPVTWGNGLAWNVHDNIFEPLIAGSGFAGYSNAIASVGVCGSCSFDHNGVQDGTNLGTAIDLTSGAMIGGSISKNTLQGALVAVNFGSSSGVEAAANYLNAASSTNGFFAAASATYLRVFPNYVSTNAGPGVGSVFTVAGFPANSVIDNNDGVGLRVTQPLVLTTPLAATSGGTGKASYVVGDLLYANTTTSLTSLAAAATTNALISNGVTTAPSWGKIGNTTLVNSSTTVNGIVCTLGSSCTITAAAGSIIVGTTLVTSGTSHGVLTNNAGTLANTAAGTNGQLFLGVTAGEPNWGTMSGDGSITNTGVFTAASTIVAGGPTGSATVTPIISYDAKGRLITVTSATITPAVGSITGLGTGVATALGTNIGTAGSFVVNGGALGSPSSAGTMPAFTLGNTVSGGGNQINNVLIGTVTPLPGAFTTLTASTSVTSPIDYGGSAAGSTKLINGTSNGSPSSAFLNLQSAGQFTSFGNTSPKTYLDLNENLTSSPALVVSTSLSRLQAADTLSGGLEFVSYNSTSARGNIISGAVAAGTSASPTATGTGGITQAMYNMRGYGWTGSAWAAGGLWLIQNAETWDGTHQGTNMDWYTTPLASTAITFSMRLQPSGGLSIGATTDPGVGGLQVNGQSFFPNVASDTATVDSTACIGPSGKLLKGTGALGVCLGTSSARYKHDIVSMGAGLAEIVQLTPKNFFYNKDVGDGGARLQYGFIAEDVMKVLPGVTAPDTKGKPNSVDMVAMIPVMVNAIKQLKADNDNLRMDVLALQARKKYPYAR